MRTPNPFPRVARCLETHHLQPISNSRTLMNSLIYLVVPLALAMAVLLVSAVVRYTSWKLPVVRADHYPRMVRGMAAFVAIAALLTTAIGTWRGSAMKAADDFEVIVPTRAPHEITGSDRPGRLDIGPSKLIVNVIIARQSGSWFVPLQGASRFIEWKGGVATPEFDMVWQGVPFRVSVGFENFSQDKGILSFWHFAGQPAIEVSPAQPNYRSLDGSRPIGMLNKEPLVDGAAQARSPFSLVPLDDMRQVFLLVHVARADHDDPLGKAPVGTWLPNQPMAAGRSYPHPLFSEGPEPAPGFRMLAYLGPAAWWLALAAAAGSLCFRRGWRAPAFAGLTVAMVIYAGSLDSLVLMRRARVMNDATLPEATRITAMLSLQSTFFHKARAGAALDEMARDAKTPTPLREAARFLRHDRTNPD